MTEPAMTEPVAGEPTHNDESPGRLPPIEFLRAGSLTVLGQLTTASNATLLCEVAVEGLEPPDGPSSARSGATDATGPRAVYKPIAGERPLRDFPPGTLAGREVASYLISEALGWSLIPPTVFRDGPFGPGAVQWWIEDLDDTSAVIDLFPPALVPAGWAVVLEGSDPQGEAVSLAHADRIDLQRMAVLDLILNNADRKAGHIMLQDGQLFGVDHGLTFHPASKLRTVLWGWAGQKIPDHLLAEVRDLAAQFSQSEPDRGAGAASLRAQLEKLLGPPELHALRGRFTDLLNSGRFPDLPERRFGLPWPLW